MPVRARECADQVPGAPLSKIRRPFFHDFGDARLQRDQTTGNRVGNKIRNAHAKLAALFEVTTLAQRLEKNVDLIRERGRECYAGRVRVIVKRPLRVRAL